ncbi:MAG TPA: hypothetical protein VFS67_25560 [Polyangiaceae bacterium]|jgi:hypothetical protein|nr:hypothetical protein [Polyangiaceae bacterium]
MSSFHCRRAILRGVAAALVACALSGCERTNQESLNRALAHAQHLVETAKQDASEIRKGLPLGAEELAKHWADEPDPLADPESARRLLTRAHDKIQDLRVAKSSFFALASLDGKVVRNDREQDRMAGTQLFPAFPGLAKAANGDYVEALGSLPEAHGVKGKPDAEWVAAKAVQVGDAARALYVTGWAWSSYAYRLEFSLRNQVELELRGTRQNVPLLYVFVIVGADVYGAPASPEVSAQTIAARDPLAHLSPQGSFSTLLEITGRTFALGVQSAPDLAPRVAIAVLRSEL